MAAIEKWPPRSWRRTGPVSSDSRSSPRRMALTPHAYVWCGATEFGVQNAAFIFSRDTQAEKSIHKSKDVFRFGLPALMLFLLPGR